MFRGIQRLLFGSALVMLMQIDAATAAPKAKLIEFWNDREESSALTIDYSSWNEILETYVIEGQSPDVNRFDYTAVTEGDRIKISEFLNSAQSMDPRQLNSLEQKAYWLNLYNAALIKEVIEKEVEESVRVLGNRLWRRDRLYISMQDTSLDDIEHGILRPIYNDPRIHFSITAGAFGSGEIMTTAFTAQNVEQMLEEGARKFINHPRGVLVEADKATISSIFKWYKTDFGNNSDEIKQYILAYLDDDKKPAFEAVRRVTYDFDWQLNQPITESEEPEPERRTQSRPNRGPKNR